MQASARRSHVSCISSSLRNAAIAHFEHTIAAAVALVFFLPLLIDSGGNAGFQAATLMVRALATGDVQGRDWFHLLHKELAVVLAMGTTMGAAVSLIGIFRAPEITVVVAITVVLIVVGGCVVNAWTSTASSGWPSMPAVRCGWMAARSGSASEASTATVPE